MKTYLRLNRTDNMTTRPTIGPGHHNLGDKLLLPPAVPTNRVLADTMLSRMHLIITKALDCHVLKIDTPSGSSCIACALPAHICGTPREHRPNHPEPSRPSSSPPNLLGTPLWCLPGPRLMSTFEPPASSLASMSLANKIQFTYSPPPTSVVCLHTPLRAAHSHRHLDLAYIFPFRSGPETSERRRP